MSPTARRKMDSSVENMIILSHVYSKTKKTWKVTWQKQGKKRIKRNQRVKHYVWNKLPRELARMYLPDGRLCNEFNPTIIKLRKRLNDVRRERLDMRMNGSVPISSFHQAEIPEIQTDTYCEEKMKLIEAQQVNVASDLTGKQLQEVEGVAKQLENNDFRQAVFTMFEEGCAERPIDLT